MMPHRDPLSDIQTPCPRRNLCNRHGDLVPSSYTICVEVGDLYRSLL